MQKYSCLFIIHFQNVHTEVLDMSSGGANSSNIRMSQSKGQKTGSLVASSPLVVKSTSRQAKLGMSISSLLPSHPGSTSYRLIKGGGKIPRYQNSYRLTSYNPLRPEAVDTILQEVMTKTLTNTKYNPDTCLKLCQVMAAEVRSRILKKDYDRYKFVVQMSIVEKSRQGLNVASGRLWDVERDNHSSFIFENTHLYAIGMVAGLYYY